jgi:hypothetical protein
MKTAAERKAESVAARKRARKVTRKSGKVKVYYVKPAKEAPSGARKTAYEMRTPSPDGLSLQAEWETLRPKKVHPWDWHHLFPGENKELWPIVREEALHAVKVGELEEYRGVANRGRKRNN